MNDMLDNIMGIITKLEVETDGRLDVETVCHELDVDPDSIDRTNLTVRFSLRTADQREARARARRVTTYLNRLIDHARRQG